MEELSRLQTGFAAESDSFLEAVKTRKTVLDGYIESLTKVKILIDGIATTHQNEVVKLLDEKEKLNKENSASKDSHEKALAIIAKAHSDKVGELSDKEKKIADINQREIDSNKRIDVLMVEYREVEKKISEIRVNHSIADRKLKDLNEQVKTIEDSLTKKRAEEVTLTTIIESKQKQATRLSNDIAILEARK